MWKTLLVQQTSRETVGEPVIVVLAVLLIEGNRKVITVSGKIYVLSIIVHTSSVVLSGVIKWF